MAVLLVVFFFFTSDCYITNFDVFDWYTETANGSYAIFNLTYLHIIEIIILSVCSYGHR